MREVRRERTGWRDKALSRRHRQWGWDCPAVDIDFLLLEYDTGKAAAIVEYKNERAKPVLACHPTYQAMIDLGNRAGVPVIVCRYTDDFSSWMITPLNDEARKYIPQRAKLTEREWVSLLYKIRGYEVPQKVLDDLNVEV